MEEDAIREDSTLSMRKGTSSTTGARVGELVELPFAIKLKKRAISSAVETRRRDAGPRSIISAHSSRE